MLRTASCEVMNLSGSSEGPRTDPPDYLPTLVEAPDFPAAALFALTELARLGGSHRGVLLFIDPTAETLVAACELGGAPGEEFAPLPLGDLSNPWVAAALAMRPARSRRDEPSDRLPLDASRLSEDAVSLLVRLATLSGPVLSRLAAIGTFRRENDHLRQVSSRLTLMLNALPDPVVITDAANNILVQNQRAEHLLAS